MNIPNDSFVVAYWLVMVVVVAGAVAFFTLGRSNARVKRKVFYWYMAVGGALVLGWFYMLFGLTGVLIFIPLYMFSGYVTLKATRFCNSCGKVLIRQFIPARYCPRCGADLNA
jgi:hypothetical protein